MNIANVFTYLKQEHSATNTCIYKQLLSQRVYNPKKRKRKAPFYRSGLTRFGSCLQRIYVAKELHLHILSPSFHWSNCKSLHYTLVSHEAYWKLYLDTSKRHAIQALCTGHLQHSRHAAWLPASVPSEQEMFYLELGCPLHIKKRQRNRYCIDLLNWYQHLCKHYPTPPRALTFSYL